MLTTKRISCFYGGAREAPCEGDQHEPRCARSHRTASSRSRWRRRAHAAPAARNRRKSDRIRRRRLSRRLLSASRSNDAGAGKPSRAARAEPESNPFFVRSIVTRAAPRASCRRDAYVVCTAHNTPRLRRARRGFAGGSPPSPAAPPGLAPTPGSNAPHRVEALPSACRAFLTDLSPRGHRHAPPCRHTERVRRSGGVTERDIR